MCILPGSRPSTTATTAQIDSVPSVPRTVQRQQPQSGLQHCAACLELHARALKIPLAGGGPVEAADQREEGQGEGTQGVGAGGGAGGGAAGGELCAAAQAAGGVRGGRARSGVFSAQPLRRSRPASVRAAPPHPRPQVRIWLQATGASDARQLRRSGELCCKPRLLVPFLALEGFWLGGRLSTTNLFCFS